MCPLVSQISLKCAMLAPRGVLRAEIFFKFYMHVFTFEGAFLMAQVQKYLPAMEETWVRSLGQGDPLGKGMATHSSILSWRIPSTKEPGGLQSRELQRVT